MFLKCKILAKFGVPRAILANNKTLFIDKKLKSLFEELKIKQHFALVDHPQTNDKAKADNMVMLRKLKQRLEKQMDVGPMSYHMYCRKIVQLHSRALQKLLSILPMVFKLSFLWNLKR